MAFGNLQRGTKAAFTIHNLNFGADLIGRAMGGAAVCTTVSPTYAAEVRRLLKQSQALHCFRSDVSALSHLCLRRGKCC